MMHFVKKVTLKLCSFIYKTLPELLYFILHPLKETSTLLAKKQTFILKRKCLLQKTHSHVYKRPADGAAGCHGDI